MPTLADDPRTAAAYARGKIGPSSDEAVAERLAELGPTETVQDFFWLKGGVSTAALTTHGVILVRGVFRVRAQRLEQPLVVRRGPYGFLPKVEIASPQESVVV